MNDTKHLWWLFRNMLKQAWLGDFAEAREAACWMKVHLTYESKKMSEGWNGDHEIKGGRVHGDE